VTEEQIFEKLREILVDSFEIDPARITPTASLLEDLDLDSIDAVDLAIKLQEFTGKRINPQNFKSIRTVNDVLFTVQRLIET
jgi:acyl carrier protein